MTRKNLGISKKNRDAMRGQIDHFFHLAAIYDLSASVEEQEAANVEGTRNAVQLAEDLQAGCFHHTSSIAAAGLYNGVFREDMFEEAEGLDHPYFRTKHESEGVVRRECQVPWQIYRPAIVLGDSKTGYIDKIDGPYYFFKIIQKMRDNFPKWMPMMGKQGMMMLSPVRRIRKQMLKDLGIPAGILSFINYPTRFDSREAQKALKGSGIELPRLEDYAWRLWDYWERHLDPDLFIDQSLESRVAGKRVMVTGASSGIGKATALMLGEAGAKVIIVARGEEKLLETKKEIEARGGQAFCYTADLSDMDSADALINKVKEEHGGVDILVNNAGHSIRRSIRLS